MVEQEQRGTARANYGDELIKQLDGDLSPQFGRGFGVVNLGQMKRVFLTWPDKRSSPRTHCGLSPCFHSQIRARAESRTARKA